MKTPILSNLHTHSTFCDGKHTPREVVLSAIDMGMETVGFSGHAPLYLGTDFSMSQKRLVSYREEIMSLKGEFADRIRILLGIEQDYFSDPITKPYDYIIGSVHYVGIDGEYCAVDLSADTLKDFVSRRCGGDWIRFAQEYYKLVADVERKTQCDIVGHFDLLTKFNEGGALFDETDPAYRKAALEALDVLLEKKVIFEINTGAISRGYRRTPYPAPFLLRYIAMNGGEVTLTADAHSKENLLYGFDLARQYAHSCGVSSLLTMTREGWRRIPI